MDTRKGKGEKGDPEADGWAARVLKEDGPRLTALAEKVARVHGGRHPELAELELAVERLFRELGGGDGPGAGRAADPALPDGRHAEAVRLMEIVRDHASGFMPPADACNSYRALFHGLERLEADLHAHLREERAMRNADVPRGEAGGCGSCCSL